MKWNAKRNAYLIKDVIRSGLKKPSVVFVVAYVGDPLKWIEIDMCFEFWKSEAQHHIADFPDHICLNDFPKNYAYIASEWASKNNVPIILLEMIH